MAECLHSEDGPGLSFEENGGGKHDESSQNIEQLKSGDVEGDTPGGLWHYTKKIGTSSYNALHWLGGKFAYWLGISTPEWQYAIDIYEDMKRKEEERKKEEEKMIQELQESVANRLSGMEDGAPSDA